MFASKKDVDELNERIDSLAGSIEKLRKQLQNNHLIGGPFNLGGNLYTWHDEYPIVDNFRLLLAEIGYDFQTITAKKKIVKIKKSKN